MISKLANNPEKIYKATDYVKTGEDVSLSNRLKLTMQNLAIVRASADGIRQEIDSIVSDGVTPDEKRQLASTLRQFESDWSILSNEADENGVSDSQEFTDAQSAFIAMRDLFNRILADMDSVYTNPDAASLTSLTDSFINASEALNAKINSIQSDAIYVNDLNSSVKAEVSVGKTILDEHEWVSVYSAVYKGQTEYTISLPASWFRFIVTGYSFPQGKDIDDWEEFFTSSVAPTIVDGAIVIDGVKQFGVKQDIIGESGLSISLELTFDSGSFPS